MTVIRTPDQRVRVFISALPEELGRELAAVRRAVRRLRLTPLMVETPSGAAPAQDVWRAYLEQSQVFVGVYGQAYGAAIDDTGVSQQEDECLRAAHLPRLLYARGRAAARDPRLAGLLARVSADGPVTYRAFDDVEELQQVVVDDLAVLLTERYESARMAASVPAPRGAAPPPVAASTMPSAPTSLVGRAGERLRLRELLLRQDVRLVTLTGPGGIGKTRLALAVAADLAGRFDGGVRWADVSTLRDPTLLASALVHALHLPEAAGRTPFDTLVGDLRDRRVLLVVDSFERVAAAGPTLAQLLAACPLLTVLVTSRALVRVRGEHDFPVAPLPVHADGGDLPDAVRLFAARAQAVDPSFHVTADNLAQVVQICERLDGLPLAIELAAARIRLLSPATLVARLDHRLELLTGGPRDLPERQRALRAALDWDYDLLDDAERKVFRRLSVCANRSTLEAVEAITVDPGDEPFDLLLVVGSLVDKSLVRHLDEDPSRVRLAMLETVREYAQQRLDEAGEDLTTRQRHAAYFLGVAETCSGTLRSRDQLTSLARLEADHDNMRAAVRWAAEYGDTDTELRLCAALSVFWHMHGHLREGTVLLEGALSRSVGLRTAARAEVLAGAAIHARARHDFVSARAWLEEALEIHAELGDRAGIALMLRQLGNVAYEQDDLDQARMQWQHSRDAYAEIGDDTGVAQTLNNLALLERFDGNLDTALRLFARCVDASARIGDQVGAAKAYMNLANVVRDLGEPAIALALSRRSARQWVELGDPWNLTDCIEGAAATSAVAGEVDTAIRLYASAAALRDALGVGRADSERAEYDAAIERLRAVAGAERFIGTWTEGERLSHLDAAHLVEHVADRIAVADSAVDAWLSARSAVDVPW